MLNSRMEYVSSRNCGKYRWFHYIIMYFIPIYRSHHPKKEHTPIQWGIVLTWIIGIVGALLMGFGMSRIMHGTPNQTDMIIGMICGVIGLLICVLNYPIYSYLNRNKE